MKGGPFEGQKGEMGRGSGKNEEKRKTSRPFEWRREGTEQKGEKGEPVDVFLSMNDLILSDCN